MRKDKFGHEVPSPPITNRGVTCTEPQNTEMVTCTALDDLTIVIDWCQITVKGLSSEAIAEDLLRIPYFLMSNDFRGGLKGGYHALMCFDDIRVYEATGKNKEQGYQVVMAGQGCRNYEKFLEANNETWYDFLKRALELGVNFPRIDLAIDDHKPYFRIAKLARLAQDGMAITKLRIGSAHVGFTVTEEQKKRGDTLYIGSSQSEFYMCFYEKGYEQAEKLGLKEVDENWNRYELRFRQKRAVNLAKALVERRSVAVVAMEALNESIRFVKRPKKTKDVNRRRWPLWEPWAWFMRGVGKLKLTTKPKIKDYYDRLAWLQKSVFPILKAYLMVDQMMGTSIIEDSIRKTLLDKKHLWIVESCVKQLQQELLDGEDQRKLARDSLELYEKGFLPWDGFETPFE